MLVRIPLDSMPRPYPSWWDGVSFLYCDTSDRTQFDWLDAYIENLGWANNRAALAQLLVQMDRADLTTPAEEEARANVAYWFGYELHAKITTLLYLATRYGFDHERCLQLRKRIGEIDDLLAGASQAELEAYIAYAEEEHGDFFGEDISDDSDDEYFDDDDPSDGYSASKFLEEYERKAALSWRKAAVSEDDFEVEDLPPSIASGKQPMDGPDDGSDADVDEDAALLRPVARKGLEKRPKVPRTCRILRDKVHPCGRDVRARMPRTFNSPFIERDEDLEMRGADDWTAKSAENAFIHYPDGAITDQVLADLDTVNEALAQGIASIDTLTQTKFCVAQYRGVSYNVRSFNAAARRANREQYELRLAIYAASVFEELDISPGEFYAGVLGSEAGDRLAAVAKTLEGVLLQKRVSTPVTFMGKEFENEAYALQHFYTNSYDGFHKALASFFDAKSSKADDGTARVFGGLLNGKNPFVSTGNTPRHALRYAYGTKYYEDPEGLHKKSRLRPRWRKDGRAERPYSGKVYVSLHPLSDYLFPGPLDVVTLHKNKKVTIGTQIVPERESSFPAHIPADRIVAEHVAKYPSFDKGYHPIFEHKYGLYQDEYDELEEAIYSSAPHSEERRTAARAIGEWLARYHEARLVEMTRRIAEKRKMILVYRDAQGYFSIQLPIQTQRKGPNKATRCASKGRSFNKLSTGKIFGFLPRKKKEWKPSGSMLKYEMFERAQRKARRFEEWIRGLFTVHPTPPDGNCLFSAIAGAFEAWLIAHQIAIPTPDARQMRLNAVAYLRVNNPYNLPNAYLDEMAKVATASGQVRRWGGDHEIDALAHSLHLCIRVYAASEFDGYFDYNAAEMGNGILCVYHVGGNHWEWLTPNAPASLTQTFVE